MASQFGFATQIGNVLDLDTSTVADVNAFITYSALGLPAYIAYFVLQGVMIGHGRWWEAVLALTLSNGAMLGVSSPLLAAMGLPGAAVALAVQRWIGTLALLAAVWWTGVLRPVWSGWHVDEVFNWSGMKQLLSVGVPAAMSFVSQELALTAFVLMAASLGEDQLSAMSLASTVYGQSMCLFTGMSRAASVFIALCVGSNQPQRVRGCCDALVLSLAWGAHSLTS